MFIFTSTFMFTFTSMSNVDAHVRRQSDRCRPSGGEKEFRKICVFFSALEVCLCKGIAFGMHPSKLHKQVATAKALWEQNY